MPDREKTTFCAECGMPMSIAASPGCDRHERCPHRETIDPNAALMAARNNAHDAGLEQAARICEREDDLTTHALLREAVRSFDNA